VTFFCATAGMFASQADNSLADKMLRRNINFLLMKSRFKAFP
jgi:hypothetical protein